MENQDRFRNWQRDLLGIALYVAGVVIFVTALPGLVAAIITIFWAATQVQDFGALARQLPGGIVTLLAAPVLQAVVGLVLANRAWAISKEVDPGT